MARITTLIIFITIMLTTSLSVGDIPRTMHYQGILTDASGQPVADGTYDLTFKIYDISAGGSHTRRRG